MPVLIPSRRGVRIFKNAAAILFAAIFSCAGASSRAQEISKEYQVKAVFIFNFTHFVVWPTNSFSTTNSPLTIGVLGDDPFGDFLAATVSSESVNGHPLKIEHYRSVQDAKDCQILFISRSEKGNMEKILSSLKNSGVLTVSDAENFSEQGGIIGFLTTPQNKIHFVINANAAKKAGLNISSKLLRLADIVETKPGA
jgi:hypothetical protein